MLFAVALSGLTLTACSEDELSTNQYNKSGVNILAFGPMPVTRGETIRLTGTKLDQVKEVLFPEGNQKLTPATTYLSSQFTLTNSEEMTVTIPDLCVPGKLRLVTNSNDTVVSASNITFVEEIKVESFTPSHVRAGDIVTIKGEFVWNIAEVIFSANVKVAAENFVKNTRKEVQVRVPIDAVSGPVTYNDGSEGAEDIVLTENLLVDEAVATSLSNQTPDFGEQITIYGENLDLVQQVDFPSVPGVEFAIANDGKSIVVTVPDAATSGAIVLTSYSGLVTAIDVTLPMVSYEAGSISPAKNLKAGQTVSFKGDNLDRVQSLILPGKINLEKGQFTQSKNEISFVVPEEMGDGKVTLVQHNNWSVETDRIAMYAPEGPVKVLWKGNEALGWNSAGQIYLGTSGAPELVEAGAKAGDKLRIKFEPTGGGWCAQIWEGHWHGQYDEIKAENYDLVGEGGYYTLTLTDALIAEFTGITGDELGWGGILLVQGQEMNVTELALVQMATEKVLWEGTFDEPNWTNWEVGKGTHGDGNPNMFSEAGIKAGQALRVYVEPKGDWWQIQFFDGHWGALDETGADTGANNGKNVNPDFYTLGEDKCIKFVLSKETVEKLTTLNDWGAAWIIQCENLVVKKITVSDN